MRVNNDINAPVKHGAAIGAGIGGAIGGSAILGVKKMLEPMTEDVYIGKIKSSLGEIEKDVNWEMWLEQAKYNYKNYVKQAEEKMSVLKEHIVPLTARFVGFYAAIGLGIGALTGLAVKAVKNHKAQVSDKEF